MKIVNEKNSHKNELNVTSFESYIKITNAMSCPLCIHGFQFNYTPQNYNCMRLIITTCLLHYRSSIKSTESHEVIFWRRQVKITQQHLTGGKPQNT
jgi:hypothetical protein